MDFVLAFLIATLTFGAIVFLSERICHIWIYHRLENINRRFYDIDPDTKLYFVNGKWSVVGHTGISSIRMFHFLKRFQWSGYSSSWLDTIHEVCAKEDNEKYLCRSQIKPF